MRDIALADRGGLMRCSLSDTTGEEKELTAQEHMLCIHDRLRCDQAKGCKQIRQNLQFLSKPPAYKMEARLK